MNEIELERRLCVVEDRSKSNSHRIKAVEGRQEDMTQLVTSVAAIAQKQQDMDGDVQEIKAEVKAINQKPAKRWESIVEKTILASVVVLVAYVAVKLGLM